MWLTVTKTLACHNTEVITTVKSFKVQAPELNDGIKPAVQICPFNEVTLG
jgi:hypothetical protein